MKNLAKIQKEKDKAYWERNQLVSALSKIYPSWLERHPEEDKEWEDDWRWIVFIVIPGHDYHYEMKTVQGGFKVKDKNQLSWHIHDSDFKYFKHLEIKHGNSWDGHSTERKYKRLENIKRPKWWRLK